MAPSATMPWFASRHAQPAAERGDRVDRELRAAERRVVRARDLVGAGEHDHVVDRGDRPAQHRDRRAEQRVRVDDRAGRPCRAPRMSRWSRHSVDGVRWPGRAAAVALRARPTSSGVELVVRHPRRRDRAGRRGAAHADVARRARASGRASLIRFAVATSSWRSRIVIGVLGEQRGEPRRPSRRRAR